MNEFDRIARYFKPLAAEFPGALNLSDDAAILQITSDAEVVVTTDAMVEGVHFSASDTPQTIAQRLLRSNLSDLAAMGAQPLSYTLNIALPKDTPDDWLAAFSATLHDDQKKYAIHLMGGDSVSTLGGKHFSITALGLVPRGQALRRTLKRTMQADDCFHVYVTGTIGDSALGLMVIQGKPIAGITSDDVEFLKQRHYAPEPRLELARTMRGFALAAVDISDGLVADINHIAVASTCHATIEADNVPLSPAAKRACDANPALIETIVSGGEDYELAFIVDAKDQGFLKIVAEKINTPLTKIGTLTLGIAGIDVLDKDKRVMTLKQQGWQHF